MVTVFGDEEPATQEQATPIRFDTSYEQPENLSLDQYIDAAVERAIRKLDAPVATMIRSFNATPDRHENMIIATPQRLNDTVMVTPHQLPDETFIDPHDSPSNPRDVATPEPLDTTLTPETNKEDWYESYGWSTPAAVAPAPVPTTSSKEHTPRTPREEASTQHRIPSELDRDMDADHNFDRSTERETERSEIPHGTDDLQTSRADRHETPLRHTKHHDESADRNADRNATRNADRNADRHKVRCTEEVNEDGEPIESSDEEFEEAKEDPPAKRLYAIDMFKVMSTSSDGKSRNSLLRISKSFGEISKHGARTGYFLDLTCTQNRNLLTEDVLIEGSHLYDSNIAWLVWDQYGFLKSSELSLPLSTFSDLIVADEKGLLQTRKIWRDHPVESFIRGQWDNQTEEYILLPESSKIDLKKSVVRGSMTFIQDIYDRDQISQQLQDVDYRPGFDIVNRFYHSNILLLSNLYNFKLQLKVSEDWGDRADNGTWSGMLGMLQRDEVDLSVTPMMPVSYRMEVSTPTLSLVPYWIAVVFKQPRALGTYKAMLLELSTGTWACVFGLIIVGAISFATTQLYEPDTDPTYDSDGSFAMGVVQSVGIIANQGLCLMPKGTSSRIVCFSLLVVGLIVSTYYSAATMTALLSPSPAIIKNVDELLQAKIPIHFRNASYVRHLSVRHRVFPGKFLKLMEPPDLKLWSLSEGTRLIQNGSAFVDEYFVLFQNINSQFKSDVICDLTVYNAGYYSFVLSFIKKDPHFRELFVRGITRLFEHGLVQKERQRWIANRLGCSRVVQFIHVQMEAVSVAFVVFSIGFLFSVVSEHNIAIRILQQWFPEEFLTARVGVFVDLLCHENQLLIGEAVESWFNLNYAWLMAEIETNYSGSYPHSLSFYSDVVVIRNKTLYQVTHFVENAPTEVLPIGYWNSSEGKLNVTIPVITPNLHRTKLTGSYYAVQDIYDKRNVSKQLQDPTFKHGFDSGNRFFYSVILEVSDIYNFSVDLVEAQEWGLRSPNGTWNGIVGQLQRRRSDVGLTPLLPFSQRLEVTFALPVLQKYWFALIFKQPRALGTYKAMILELTPELWGMVILTFIVGAFVVHLTLNLEERHKSSLDLGFVQSVGILTNQGLSVMPTQISARIACFSLMFISLLVTNYYNASTMTALLSEAPPTIKTFDEFLKSDIKIKLINATYMTRISGRKRVFHPKSWERMLGDLGIVSLQDGLEAIRKGQAFCAEYYILFEGIDSNFKDEEKCSLTVFSVNVVFTAIRFVRKDTHLLEMLSRGLIKTLEYGISRKKRDDWIKGPPSCFRNVPFVHVRLESM
ncbi:hypothetical protein GE061_012452 [Apolygus lucorum]|uniref:Ionotropic glutamate receptor C-terminal domain-containing protein n=1 Tax=Apolygus lucorum TaxID=248454 RepID=A0A8S9XWF6_APOLU|nr:hypothetical protein GE061_012452 [Apolygus lucorum]